MESASPDPIKNIGEKRMFAPWVWMPLLVGGGSLFALLLATVFPKIDLLAWPALAGLGATLMYFLVQFGARLFERHWRGALFAFLRLAGVAASVLLAMGWIVMRSFFGPSEDGFADNLTIPEGIEIAEPDPDTSEVEHANTSEGTDELQLAVRAALAVPGNDVAEFAPDMPSVRRASTDHHEAFRDYIEASPDWHVFIERGNRFAARRWSYGGEPRDELHGYISEFEDTGRFQTRCLICLDRKQWSRYSVQQVEEGTATVKPEMSGGNSLHESRVMIECGGVWVEIFEQSDNPERRVTKATVSALEKEFSSFLKNPQAAVEEGRGGSREMARRLAGEDGHPFRLLTGMQPGIYGVVYSLNPGEPGSVYLKAFEVTKGTQLSADWLEGKSETRMAWSADPAERFSAKAGFTIYEGDWDKPYAARFEVWFKPDSGKAQRKLAERVYKIEGWQR